MQNDTPKVTIDELHAGRSRGACYRHIASLDTIRFNTLTNHLVGERIMRKYDEIIDINRRNNGDWAETLHVVLFRFLGGKHNRTATERLAGIINSRMIMRENSSLTKIEALLMGGAGLLDIYNSDDYINLLRQEFNHMATKYNITPMSHEEWQFSGMYHNNHPTLRIAQIAACLHENKISIPSITSCITRSDVYNLFSGNASEYWMQQVLTTNTFGSITPRIGSFKSDILGINLVVPMIYAYGTYIESQTLVSRAMTLLHNIPAEDNRYTRLWSSHIPTPKSAVESQAFIQLSTVYCEMRRCDDCPLAKLLTFK